MCRRQQLWRARNSLRLQGAEGSRPSSLQAPPGATARRGRSRGRLRRPGGCWSRRDRARATVDVATANLREAQARVADLRRFGLRIKSTHDKLDAAPKAEEEDAGRQADARAAEVQALRAQSLGKTPVESMLGRLAAELVAIPNPLVPSQGACPEPAQPSGPSQPQVGSPDPIAFDVDMGAEAAPVPGAPTPSGDGRPRT